MAGPLSGIAVVEVSETLAAQAAVRMLAEAGADVVKVEPPDGDPLRERAPVGWASWNRGKRIVTLDLATDAGRAGLDALVSRADVVVHDRPPARAAAEGLDGLVERHPHLIAAGVTAFPAWHARRDDPGEELLVQAASGVMDEQLGNRPGPIAIRMPYASWCAACLLACGVVARLVQRARTGVVAPVATSLLQGVMVPTAMFWQRSERLPDALDMAHTLPKMLPGASLSLFECADGRWIQLAGALGGWIESPPVLEQLALRDEVDLSLAGVTAVNLPRWQQVFRELDAAEWFDRFGEADVPCMLVRDLGECFGDEQARVNGYVAEVEDSALGPMVQVASPVVTDPPCTTRTPASACELDGLLADFGRREPDPAWHRRTDPPPPLAGVGVLDFGTMVAAPFAGQCFADFGADVVKVERLGGDRGRTLTQFAGANRGKRSLEIDLKHSDAREPLHRLIADADVVVHNIRTGAARRLGLDLAGLRAVNDRIVFTHVSANGELGPHAHLPGYDPTAQAMTGWERANVGPDAPPIWMRNSVLDVASGLATVLGGLLALHHRETTGTAGSSECSLLSVGMTIASETALRPDGTPFPVPVIDRDQTGTSRHERIHRTRDGWVAAVATDAAARAVLDDLVGDDGVADLDQDDALRLLTDYGIACAPVLEDRMHPFFDDADNRAHGLARTLTAVDYGELETVAGFWTMPGTGDEKQTVPALGADTIEVLARAGCTPEEIDALLHAGAVRTRQEVS